MSEGHFYLTITGMFLLNIDSLGFSVLTFSSTRSYSFKLIMFCSSTSPISIGAYSSG